MKNYNERTKFEPKHRSLFNREKLLPDRNGDSIKWQKMRNENIEAQSKLVVFLSKKIRRLWHKNEWYYSVVDICSALMNFPNDLTARKYWNKLSQRLREEGSEVVTSYHRLKLEAPDGKMRAADCADTEGIFRIIQSIPSSKAEPFKRWLAKVGKERIEEIENPELAQERMKEIYEQKGWPIINGQVIIDN